MIVAVSKQQPATSITEAYAAGQRHFGENYLQEALTKIEQLREPGLCWHFIGPLQSNKTRPVAEHFDWVHTVDRERIARRLDAQRSQHAKPLNVLIQLNLDGDPRKSGVSAAEVPALAGLIASLPRLALRGLMTIPPAANSDAENRRHFLAVAALAEELRGRGFALDTLSMGMSGDFETAIECGSDCVRIGTAIFGARPGAAA
jgi:hypothetical protein